MHARDLPFLLALGFFVIAAISVFQRMRRFVKLSKMFTVGPSSDKAIRVDTPLGGFDLKADDSHDPTIASMPKYPGALPVDPGKPGAVAEINIAGRRGRYLVQQLSTGDPASVVADYYRLNFPEWEQDTQYESGTRFQQNAPGCFRTISIPRTSGSTRIQYEVVLSGNPGAMAAGPSLR